MDDMGSEVKNFDELVPTLREIFTCVRRSGLKFLPEKCMIRMQRLKFLENVITPEGISPEKTIMDEFLQFEKIQMPKTIKQIKPLFGFSQFV